MAPKRKANQSAEEPLAKQNATTLKKQGVSQRSFNKVAEALSHPLAALPEECQQMLLAGLAHSLCVPSDERQEVQNQVVSMIEEVTSKILGGMQLALDAETEKVAGAEAKKAELDQIVKDAEVALQAAKDTTSEREAKLQTASEAVCTTKAALSERLKDQKTGDEGIVKVRAEKEHLEGAKSECFEKLKSGAVVGKDAKQALKKLEPYIKQTSADASLVTAAPATLLKPPEERGGFDTIVINTLETNFATKLAELEAQLAQAAPAAAERAAEVQKAQDAHAAAESQQKEASVELCAAKEAQKEAAAAVTAASKAVEDYEPEYSTATEARDAKKADLETYVDGGLATFKELKDRISAKKKRELAKAEAEAAAVATAAATAAAEAAAEAEEEEAAAAAEAPEQARAAA